MLLPLLAIAGFVNAAALYYQHFRVLKGEKMYCLLGGDCQAVVESKYGQTFGVKNELWGMLFYLAVLFLTISGRTSYLPIIALAGAFFSLYLLFLQAIILKKYCSWCLIAILINISISIISH